MSANCKLRGQRIGILIGVCGIFFLLLIFGATWGILRFNSAQSEKKRLEEEEKIALEIIHERNIDRCVGYLRELAISCTEPSRKQWPGFSALQKKARECVSYLEAFPDDFEKYLKKRNEPNMLPWWKEKIFGNEK